MNKQCYWIWLSRIENISTTVLYQLLEKYKEPENIWKLTFAQLVAEGIDFYTAQSIIEPTYRTNLEKYLNYMGQNQIELITYLDKDYPTLLREIYDFPIVLYVKGNKKILNENFIAIVGCRNCTNYGEKVAKKFAFDLSQKNINVISGMARGIDTFAHIGCLQANKAKTVAVLGSGLDTIYPPENKMLYENIVKTGGAVISEYVIGRKPIGTNFPRRNRIISGMAKSLIVIEAKLKSGTFITVDFALEQGKDIYAVPGNINSLSSQGTNELLKQGAIPITKIEDIF